MPSATEPEDQGLYQPSNIWPLTVRVQESFEEFVHLNPDLKVEQNSNGEILIMSPTGGESANLNSEINFQLRTWAKQYGGFTFDSSVLFCLPDGSKRSPDATWIAAERWLALPVEERKKFPSISPDFVIELRSESDTLKELQTKMQAYLINGIRLGWLVDPFQYCVHIYQPGIPVEILKLPETVSSDGILPGFSLDMTAIWKDN